MNISNDDKPSSINTAVGFVAIISAVNIVISVLFEIGYYHRGLGINIPSLPTTMSDHFKACFMWLPFFLSLLASVCIGILVAIVKTKDSRTGTDNTDFHCQLTLLQALKPRKGLIIVFSIFILFAVVSYLTTHKMFHVWYIFIVAMLQLYNHIVNALHVVYYCRLKYEKYWYYVVSAVPYLVVMAILAGYYSAKLDLDSKNYSYEIILKDPSSHKIRGNVLRSYDKITFIVYSSQKLVFIQNDQIKMIAKQ